MKAQSFAITPSRLLVFGLLLLCSPLILVLRIGYGISFGVLVIAAWFIGTFSKPYIYAYGLVMQGISVPDWLNVLVAPGLAYQIIEYEIYVVGVHAVLIIFRAILKKDYRYHTAYIGIPTIPISRKFDKKLLLPIVLSPLAVYFFPQYLGGYVSIMWIPPLAVMAVAYFALLNMARADYTLPAFDPIQQRYTAPKKADPSLVKLATMPRASDEALDGIFSRRPEGLAKLAICERE